MNIAAISMQILGTGEFVPEKRVESEHFDRRWGKDLGWTYEQTGVASRAFVGPGEDTITMGTAAAQRALEAADVDASQLDAIISVGSVPYQAIPCTAVFLQRALGLGESGIPAFDINATCLGFIMALDVVSQAIALGKYRHVLIVASEPSSVGLNWDDPSTAGLFGDGAGAVVLGQSRREGAALRASYIQTFSAGLEFCQIRGGGSALNPRHHLEESLAGSVFEMNGRETYRLAAQLLPGFLSRLLGRAGVESNAIDVWVPHQASGRAIAHLQMALQIPVDGIVLTLETLGNQVSASLPIALHRGIESGRIQAGHVVALIGSGAGLSFGGAVLNY
jgi:3-oxoacyl-[acyl-carrier-protein] synthase-3